MNGRGRGARASRPSRGHQEGIRRGIRRVSGGASGGYQEGHQEGIRRGIRRVSGGNQEGIRRGSEEEGPPAPSSQVASRSQRGAQRSPPTRRWRSDRACRPSAAAPRPPPRATAPSRAGTAVSRRPRKQSQMQFRAISLTCVVSSRTLALSTNAAPPCMQAHGPARR